MTSSSNESTRRICAICLDSIVDDNSRGKAELICSHIFHLDCIGSEFNYRGEMRCPSCRVIENGEWLLPDDDSEDDDDDDVTNRRLEIHIYAHDLTDNANSASPGQVFIAPTVHYHQHTVALPPPPPPTGATTGASSEPLYADVIRRAFGGPPGSDSTRPSRVVPETSSNAGEVRAYYHGSSYGQNSSSSAMADTVFIRERRNQRISESTNNTRSESLSTFNERDPSSELIRLSVGSSEYSRLARRVLEERQRGDGSHERLGNRTG